MVFSQRVERLPGSLGGVWQLRPADGWPDLGHQANLFPLPSFWPHGIIDMRRCGGEARRGEIKGKKEPKGEG